MIVSSPFTNSNCYILIMLVKLSVNSTYLLSESEDLQTRVLWVNIVPGSHSTHQSNKIFGNSYLMKKKSIIHDLLNLTSGEKNLPRTDKCIIFYVSVHKTVTVLCKIKILTASEFC